MAQTELNRLIQDEISQLSEKQSIDPHLLEEFAVFVIENYKEKDKAKKPLTLAQLKKAVYKYFKVNNTTELKQSSSFKMATDGLENLNLRLKADWEKLYREFVGILPEEGNQQGYGCINGINIFDYFKPWQVFGLDPKKATQNDIKKAYRQFSKKYHPDVPKTGDSKIFDRLNTMYKSITAGA